jgi:hypothetical protein
MKHLHKHYGIVLTEDQQNVGVGVEKRLNGTGGQKDIRTLLMGITDRYMLYCRAQKQNLLQKNVQIR